MSNRVYFPMNHDAREQYWGNGRLERLARVAEVVEPVQPDRPWSKMPTDLDGMVVGWGASRMPAEVWRAQRHLRIVSIFGGSAAGAVENALELLDRGVLICNVADEIAEGVAEETVALMLASQLDIVNGACRFRLSMDRSYPPVLGRSLSGSTVGIVGLGFVGRWVARFLSVFAVKLLVCDPHADPQAIERAGAEQVELRELFGRSEIVSVHAGLTSETRGMISAALLDALAPDALVISTARMHIFDEEALSRRVASGRIRLASDLIPWNEDVWGPAHASPSLIGVHSHTSVTSRTVARMADRVISDLSAVLGGSGEVGHRVTREWIEHTT